MEQCGWETRDLILSIKERMANTHWKFQWTARDSNKVTDLMAKFASNNCSNLMLTLNVLLSVPEIASSLGEQVISKLIDMGRTN